MYFRDLIQTRRSVRIYLPQPVEEEKVQSILEAANCAPSAGNLQAYEIYLVRSESTREALSLAAGNQDFILQAPVALVFCAHPARSQPRYAQRGVRLYSVQDATIACTFAMLAATELGLGSVWVGAFNDQAVRQAIGVSDELLPVAVLSIGYPGEEPEQRSRRRLKDLVHEVA